jgi:hypothetical protein
VQGAELSLRVAACCACRRARRGRIWRNMPSMNQQQKMRFCSSSSSSSRRWDFLDIKNAKIVWFDVSMPASALHKRKTAEFKNIETIQWEKSPSTLELEPVVHQLFTNIDALQQWSGYSWRWPKAKSMYVHGTRTLIQIFFSQEIFCL